MGYKICKFVKSAHGIFSLWPLSFSVIYHLFYLRPSRSMVREGGLPYQSSTGNRYISTFAYLAYKHSGLHNIFHWLLPYAKCKNGAKQKRGTSVGQLVTVASVCQLPVPHLDGLGILTTNFWAFFRCANASKLSASGEQSPLSLTPDQGLCPRTQLEAPPRVGQIRDGYVCLLTASAMTDLAYCQQILGLL